MNMDARTALGKASLMLSRTFLGPRLAPLRPAAPDDNADLASVKRSTRVGPSAAISESYRDDDDDDDDREIILTHIHQDHRNHQR